MSWLPDWPAWWKRKPTPQPAPAPVPAPLPELPTPGPVRAVNYWRALQLLKNTPFLALWQKTKAEIPGALVVLAFLGFCLFSCIFTVGWFFITLARLFTRGVTTFVRWVAS